MDIPHDELESLAVSLSTIRSRRGKAAIYSAPDGRLLVGPSTPKGFTALVILSSVGIEYPTSELDVPAQKIIERTIYG